MMIAIAIPVPELDDCKRCWIDLGFESPTGLIGAPDLVTTVVDPDPRDSPASSGGHRLHSLARLPLVHRNAAVVASLREAASGESQNDHCQRYVLHHLIVSDQCVLIANMAAYSDKLLKQHRVFLQQSDSFGS